MLFKSKIEHLVRLENMSQNYSYVTITGQIQTRHNGTSLEQNNLHCNENSIYIFLSWELRGLSLNFHIHVSVSDLYIPRIGPYIFLQQKNRPILEIYKFLTDV
jgi:hypothetical protein